MSDVNLATIPVKRRRGRKPVSRVLYRQHPSFDELARLVAEVGVHRVELAIEYCRRRPALLAQ